MRAVSRIAALVALIIPVAAPGQSVDTAPDCAPDLGDFASNAPVVPFVYTPDSRQARTLADFRNAAVNYFFYDSKGIEMRGYLGGYGQLQIPVCNEIGQCVQSSVEIRFEQSSSFSVILTVDFEHGIEGYDITVEDQGGNTSTYAAGTDRHDQRLLPVPSSNADSPIYDDQTCRSNDHTTDQPSEGDGVPASGNGGGSGSGGSVGGPDGFTGDFPTGGRVLGGGSGGGGSECWLFVARTSSGDFIQAYILCF